MFHVDTPFPEIKYLFDAARRQLIIIIKVLQVILQQSI